MQVVTSDKTLQDVRRGLLDKIKAPEKRIHTRDHAPTFNGFMQNKIDYSQLLAKIVIGITVPKHKLGIQFNSCR